MTRIAAERKRGQPQIGRRKVWIWAKKKRSENALAETACIRKARSGLAVPAGVLLAGTAGILLAAVLPFSAWAAEKGWQTVEGTMRYVNEDGAMEKKYLDL